MGESPLFPPQYPKVEEAKQAVLLVLRRSPSQFGYERSRWTLTMLRKTCDWLRVGTDGGMSQLLKHLHISYKRGRDYVHSPDPYYEEKRAHIQQIRAKCLAAPERYVLLYLDELTYYRQPTLACAYEATGHTQPLAQRSHASNNAFRVVAAMNGLTGQVTYRQRAHTDTKCLAGFWYDLRKAYPDAETIYVVLDNWPVHFHPDVLAPLQAQNLTWQPKLPGHWSQEPSTKAIHDNLPIQLVCLPTYASWLNPIEKLWRWLKQDILHLHRLSNDWSQLKQQVAQFLDKFLQGSSELLRYTGLLLE